MHRHHTVIILMVAMTISPPGLTVSRTDALPDCYHAISGAIAAQRAWSRQGFEVANRTLSNNTDSLFNLDCLKDIALAGGINIYGKNPLDILKKKLCDFANQQIDEVNARTRQQVDLPHGLGGLDADTGLGSDSSRAKHPVIRKPSASVSGRTQAGTKGVKGRVKKNTTGFSNLKDFFK